MDPAGVDVKAIRAEAQAFCVKNLRVCCEELERWHRTGVLGEGRVRELARMFTYVDEADALNLAERTVSRAAIARVAGAGDTCGDGGCASASGR